MIDDETPCFSGRSLAPSPACEHGDCEQRWCNRSRTDGRLCADVQAEIDLGLNVGSIAARRGMAGAIGAQSVADVDIQSLLSPVDRLARYAMSRYIGDRPEPDRDTVKANALDHLCSAGIPADRPERAVGALLLHYQGSGFDAIIRSLCVLAQSNLAPASELHVSPDSVGFSVENGDHWRFLSPRPESTADLPILRQPEHISIAASSSYAYTSPFPIFPMGHGRTRQAQDRGRSDGKRAQRRMGKPWARR